MHIHVVYTRQTLATSVIVAEWQVTDSDPRSASASDVPVTKMTATV